MWCPNIHNNGGPPTFFNVCLHCFSRKNLQHSMVQVYKLIDIAKCNKNAAKYQLPDEFRNEMLYTIGLTSNQFSPEMMHQRVFPISPRKTAIQLQTQVYNTCNKLQEAKKKNTFFFSKKACWQKRLLLLSFMTKERQLQGGLKGWKIACISLFVSPWDRFSLSYILHAVGRNR